MGIDLRERRKQIQVSEERVENMMSMIQERLERPPKQAAAARFSFDAKARTGKWRLAAAAAGPALCSALLVCVLGIGSPFGARAEAMTGERGAVSGRAVINMQGMSIFERQHNLQFTNSAPRAIGAPMPHVNLSARTQNVAGAQSAVLNSSSSGSTAPKFAAWQPAPAPRASSPPPATSFQAHDDDKRFIPPDVCGAVGPNHVMSVHNSNIRIQDRTGAILSTVTLDSFWLAVTGPGVFDPHVVYDPFNDRWIFTAVSGAMSDQSSVLLAVSQNNDPTGNWYLYRVDADPGNLAWADYPALGFNKDWIVVTVNMFPIGLIDQALRPFFGENIYVFSKTNLYAKGDGAFTLLQATSLKGLAMGPAVPSE